eukprot:15365747-Ditylum_brightwellii.AAC.1
MSSLLAVDKAEAIMCVTWDNNGNDDYDICCCHHDNILNASSSPTWMNRMLIPFPPPSSS